MSNTYYQDELRYLREVGPEFARVNPEIARWLGDPRADPDVERLLEGVAFLCGRLRQKLDDELPELTANMMSLLWPHYLRPIPSMTILQLLPEIEAMQAPLTVDAGTEFASIATDETNCRYRSTWPVVLRPWLIQDVALETAAGNPVRLIIRLRSSSKAELSGLDLGSVRFHLAGDARTSFAMYLLLAAHVDHVTVSDGSERHDRGEVVLGAEQVSSAGLDRKEAVLPYPPHSFAGYRLLQEYFAFKERFLFVDVKGLDRAVEELELTNLVEIAVTFNRRLESFPLVSREDIRLHCVPIVNLFEHPADPIRLRHDRTQYLVLPSKSGVADRRHLEVYSVDEVAGIAHTGGVESRVYEPFYSFRHVITSDPLASTYFQTHVTQNVLGQDASFGTDTYISFVAGSSGGQLPADETVSMELTCTNRHLPSALRAGDINQPTDSSPPGVKFRNLIKPTSTIAPPLGKALHWRLISHMSLNYTSLTDVERFKELLRVYDFQSEHDAQLALAHQRMLDGIIRISSSYHERLIRGAVARGSQTKVELDEDHFVGEGDAYLFATILDRFMALYTTLNAYSQLTVRLTKSGQVYSFTPRWGEQVTPAATRAGA
ncbi:MAG: type VI secretion system baseplate subunit TssF [Phycisphaerales bacterium]|nr:MAG: type VI secretion system baseplate subunit TssF [Phycisphaerales bacterium]